MSKPVKVFELPIDDKGNVRFCQVKRELNGVYEFFVGYTQQLGTAKLFAGRYVHPKTMTFLGNTLHEVAIRMWNEAIDSGKFQGVKIESQ